MGIFVEDLVNFGNLIDAEIEFRLSPESLKRAFPELDFEIRDGILRVFVKGRRLFLKSTSEVRLSEGGGVRKDRQEGRQWVFFRVLSEGGEERLLSFPFFKKDGEYLGMDVMPVVVLTETYEKIPKQFRDRLVISRYRAGREYISVFFRFEK